MSHSKGVPAGMDVVTIGYPQVAIQGLTPKITKGIVNSSTGLRDDKNSFQFSAEVQKGNSGGPLIGPGGTVVGVVQSKLDALKLVWKSLSVFDSKLVMALLTLEKRSLADKVVSADL